MARFRTTRVTKFALQIVALLCALGSSLTITLNAQNPAFCFDVAKERETMNQRHSHGKQPVAIEYDKTLEMHYDISG